MMGSTGVKMSYQPLLAGIPALNTAGYRRATEWQLSLDNWSCEGSSGKRGVLISSGAFV